MRFGKVLGIFSIFLVIFGLYFLSKDSDSSISQDIFGKDVITKPQKTSWIPSGFNSWKDDPNVAYRLDKVRVSAKVLAEVQVITKDGCETILEVQVSGSDRDNFQIRSIKSSLLSALPMEKSKWLFDIYSYDVRTANVRKITCE